MNGQQGTTVMNSGDLDEAHFQHSHWIIVLIKFHIIKSAVYFSSKRDFLSDFLSDLLSDEMLFIRSLKPNLNVQADSNCAKVFL